MKKLIGLILLGALTLPGLAFAEGSHGHSHDHGEKAVAEKAMDKVAATTETKGQTLELAIEGMT